VCVVRVGSGAPHGGRAAAARPAWRPARAVNPRRAAAPVPLPAPAPAPAPAAPQRQAARPLACASRPATTRSSRLRRARSRSFSASSAATSASLSATWGWRAEGRGRVWGRAGGGALRAPPAARRAPATMPRPCARRLQRAARRPPPQTSRLLLQRSDDLAPARALARHAGAGVGRRRAGRVGARGRRPAAASAGAAAARVCPGRRAGGANQASACHGLAAGAAWARRHRSACPLARARKPAAPARGDDAAPRRSPRGPPPLYSGPRRVFKASGACWYAGRPRTRARNGLWGPRVVLGSFATQPSIAPRLSSAPNAPARGARGRLPHPPRRRPAAGDASPPPPAPRRPRRRTPPGGQRMGRIGRAPAAQGSSGTQAGARRAPPFESRPPGRPMPFGGPPRPGPQPMDLSASKYDGMPVQDQYR
jgi:hypothetical protein